VPFAKRKTGRGPLQRLSDQRRSLVLAGLAAGAVVSAAVLRRRRRGGEAEFGTPEMAPSTATPRATAASSEVAATAAAATATQIDQEAPEKVAAASASQADLETETASDALHAAETAGAATASGVDQEAPEEPAEASTTLSEPTTGELSAAEASILAVLAQHGRADDDRTVIAVATSLERESADVANVLRKLSAEGVVSGELYTATGDKIWAVTERGVRRLGAQH
jgi:hypothetical protein